MCFFASSVSSCITRADDVKSDLLGSETVIINTGCSPLFVSYSPHSIIFGQLVKQIGVEPQSGSLSTVVYNSSALNSKSVTVASSNPTASANVVAKAEVCYTTMTVV